MARARRNRVGPRLVSLFDGPLPAFAKDGTNPFTRKIVEIPHRGEHLACLSAGFDPAEDHFEMLALIFRACRAGRGPIESDYHMFRRLFGHGLRGNLGFHLSLDRPSHRQDRIACRRMIDTVDLTQGLIQDIGGLLIRKLAALLHLLMPQFGCRAMWKETGNGRRDVGTAAGASFVPWTVSADVQKPYQSAGVDDL